MSKTLTAVGNAINGQSKINSSNKHVGIKNPTDGATASNPYLSLGEIAANVAISAAGLMQAARTVYCTGKLINDPMMLLDTVGLMAKVGAGIALDMAERMAKLVKNQITQALSQINGAFNSLTSNIVGYIDGIRSFLGSIKNLMAAFGIFLDTIKHGATVEYEEFCTKEDCEFMFAMMAACLLSKLLGNKLQEFEMKVSSKINNTGAKFNEALAEGINEITTFSGFLEREKFMLEKASKQIDGLHRLVSNQSASKTMGPLTVTAKTETASTTEEEDKKKKTIQEATQKITSDKKTENK